MGFLVNGHQIFTATARSITTNGGITQNAKVKLIDTNNEHTQNQKKIKTCKVKQINLYQKHQHYPHTKGEVETEKGLCYKLWC